MTLKMKGLVAAVVMLLGSSNAFYIPGVVPKTFQNGDSVDLKVNSLTSIHTQIPRDYYRLPFCRPEEGPKMASENLGEFITGNKIQSSPYLINMLTEVNCHKLCEVELGEKEAASLTRHIKNGYHHNWIIDNLPSANVGVANGEQQKYYAGGFPVGFIASDSKEAYVNNHVNIILDYHPRDGGYRVVGFSVEPLSIKHSVALDTCPKEKHMEVADIKSNQIVSSGEKIIYTYDVTWKESDVAWSSRWDVYLTEDHLVPAQVHWYSITNSILVVIFLSLLVVSILVRNLRRDIEGYNTLAALTDEESGEDDVDESGWKLVHADVFRPPDNYPMLYCVFIGSGVQLAVTILVSICFAAVGFLSPARRGSLMTALLVLYMLCGIFAGYVSSRLYKSFSGRAWHLCTVMTAVLFPGIAFSLFLVFNIVLYFLHSSASAPFLDVILLAAMWCCVSIPLVFFGAYFGYKQDAIEFPTHTSKIEREIPAQPWYLNHLLGMFVIGIIPFAGAYVELFFIMTSLWMDQFYYVFGFTLVVYLILLITCAEVTLLSVYYQLCSENHRWWWFAFFCSGSTSLYLFLYSVFWFKTLHASNMLMTYLLYFGYMSLISFMMMLVFGSTGALASFWFVHKIFGAIKVD